MQTTLRHLTIAASVCALTAGAALGQTPDGETPAEEGVCDELKAEGVSKGLYGLCIAFCEAQDWDGTCVDDPESCAKSASRILANYEKKRSADDPDMPCIVSADECPCWNGGELAPFPETTLAELWLNQVPPNCEIDNFCISAANPSFFNTTVAVCRATNTPIGAHNRVQTQAFAFPSPSTRPGNCSVSVRTQGSGTTQVTTLVLDAATASICFDEHSAFVLPAIDPNSTATTDCGLPTP